MKSLRPALVLFVLLAFITGIAYPLLVTVFTQTIFPQQAKGSLLMEKGVVRGSSLIGQSFSSPGYFWGRLSATSPFPYNGAASSGSNFGPLHPGLQEAARARLDALRAFEEANGALVPQDLLTASASGLDPDISPKAAFFQIPRIARARGMKEENLKALVEAHIKGRAFLFLGEPRVNVLALNLALDAEKRALMPKTSP